MSKMFMNVKEVMEVLEVSESYAYVKKNSLIWP